MRHTFSFTRHMRRPAQGFTVVELLVVIVVLGVLASITIVAYNGVSARADDTKMKASMNQLEKAMQQFYADTGKVPLGGYESNGVLANGECPTATRINGGWIGKGMYLCSTEDVLTAQNYIPSKFVESLPSNNLYRPSDSALLKSRRSVMVYRCGTTEKLAVMWQLKMPTTADIQSIDSTLAQCGLGSSYKTSYGMRAGRIVSF